ncbi:MAG TPA: chloride channel protein, partial [Elusimicrobiota bacterium]|nr:chloride channel protein [Elusimicrobiota bacterium]
MDKSSVFKQYFEPIVQDVSNFALNLTTHQQLIFSGVLVGGAAGLAAFLFEELTNWAELISLDRLERLNWMWRSAGLIFFPALGAFLAARLIHYFCQEAKGHGVNEVYKAIKEKDGRIPGKVAVIKLLASALTIGFGGSAGPEGPVIQIGGSVGSWIGQKLEVSTHNLKMLAASGAAAGLAVSFGVPLAAVFFTMEVLLKDFANESFPAVVIASVSGVVTASVFMTNAPVRPALFYSWHGPLDLILYALLGLVCAPFGVLYMRCLNGVEHWMEHDERLPEWFKPALGGIVVGLIALFLPKIMGTGQDTINAALQGQLLSWKSGALTLGKIAATSATLGSGGSGGAFTPALFIGATAGSAWAALLHSWLGASTTLAGGFAIVGMAAVITSSYQAPVTAIVLSLEMSRDYNILMPVMLACVVAYLTTRAHK